jgi:hypothetical protein
MTSFLGQRAEALATRQDDLRNVPGTGRAPVCEACKTSVAWSGSCASVSGLLQVGTGAYFSALSYTKWAGRWRRSTWTHPLW